MKSRILLVCAAGLALVPSLAAAQITSGWVTGTVQYYENQGNYCDTAQGQNCTDAKYTTAQYQTPRPIQDAEVRIDDQNNNVIGMGGTDANGVFLISWSSSSQPSTLKYEWRPVEKNGIFSVRYTSGNIPILWGSTTLTPIAGTTSSNPQSFGTQTWGSSGSPHTHANVYAGAQFMWDSLKDSAALQTNWTNVQVREFYTVVPPQSGPCGVCPSACYCTSGSQAYIQLTVNDPYQPQARILHEMGHHASQSLDARRQIADYCWPDTRSGNNCIDSDGDGVLQVNSWTIWQGEHMNSAFEEGFATFMGDRAIYRQTNTEPTTCLSTVACDALTSTEGTSDWVEKGEGNGTGPCNCPGGSNPACSRRSPMVVDRYLRDVYDSSNDSGSCGGDPTCQWGTGFNDTQARSFSEMLNTIGLFAQGFADHMDEEPYVSSGSSTIDARDGFGAGDYAWNYENASGGPGISTSLARQWNCWVY